MQIMRGSHTVSELLSVFDVTSTSFYRHLNQNNLQNRLLKGKHIVKKDHRTYFDDRAVLEIARTFANRKATKGHTTTKHTFNGKRTLRIMNKKLTNIDNQLAKISNKLGITYQNK